MFSYDPTRDTPLAFLRPAADRGAVSNTLQFSDELCCVPLEEIDTYHPGKTYCVISKVLNQYVVQRFTTDKTMFLFRPLHPVRRWAVYMQTDVLLQYVVTVGIISNCVMLTSEHVYNPSKYAFFGVFSFELLIRVISRGLVLHPHSILRIAWRWLDVLSLAGSTYDLVSGSAASIGIGASLLRTFRLFHILKTISIIPGLKVVISGLLRSLRMVTDMFLITLCLMILFSLMGKMVFQESLSNKCVFGNATDDNQSNWLVNDGDRYVLCGFTESSNTKCPENYTCRKSGPTPYEGLIGFDSLWSALFTVFRILTLDEWEDLFDEAVSCKGATVVVYYVLLIFLGSFFLMNLPIAMVISSYATEVNIAFEEQSIAIPDVTRYRNASEFFFNPCKLSVRIYDPHRKPARFFRRMAAVEHGPMISSATGDVSQGSDACSCDGTHICEKHKRVTTVATTVTDSGTAKMKPPEPKHKMFSTRRIREKIRSLRRKLRSLRRALRHTVSHPMFGIISAVGISINSMALGFICHEMDEDVENMINAIDEIFRYIFSVEIMMKMIGMGRDFLRDIYVVDLFIVTLNLLAGIQWNVKGVSIMRMWLAISHLERARFLRHLIMIQRVIMNSLASLVYLVMLLILTIYIFAVIGFNFFSEHYSKTDQTISVWSFSDFTHSLLIVFRILCGEWFLPFWECYKPSKNAALCTIFFFSAVICINFVLLNLILGVLLDCFDEAKLEEAEEVMREQQMVEEKDFKSIKSELETQVTPELSESVATPYLSNLVDRLRKFLESDNSELAVNITIIISCMFQCFEDYHLEESTFLWLATKLVYVTTSLLFLLELLTKLLLRGMLFKLNDWWNVIEIGLSTIFVLDIALFRKRSLQSFRVIRSFRLLRPFATQKKWRGAQMSTSVFIRSIVAVINVLIMVLYFWFVFSVIGVSLFRGKLYRCVDEDRDILETDIVDKKEDCLQKNYTWENNPINFDDVLKGYLALFQLATFEGWIEIMKATSEARGIDLQPKKVSTLSPYVYFVIFIIVGVLIALKLFVGVIVQQFDVLRRHADSGVRELLTSQFMTKYYQAMKRVARRRPWKLPPRPIRRFENVIYDMVTSSNYETGVFIIIVSYLIFDVVIYFYHNIFKELSVRVTRMIICYFFLFEVFIELWVFKLLHLQDLPNCLDFISILISAVTTAFISPLEIFAVDPLLLRLCRIVKTDKTFLNFMPAKQLRRLFLTLQISLSSISNIGLLLVLVMYVYAVIGMNLFGDSVELSPVLNFESILPSMMILFQVSTAAGWNDVFEKVIRPGTCSLDSKEHCGLYYLATIYFCTYLVICSFILLNMFVAIVLENFQEIQELKNIGFEEEDLDILYHHFTKQDPHGTGFIPVLQLSDFLSNLPDPFTVQKPNKVTLIVMDIPVCKGIRVHFVDLCSALFTFMLGKTGDKAELPLKKILEPRFKKVFPERESVTIIGSTKNLKIYERTLRYQSDGSVVRDRMWAVLMIQKAWRNYKEQQNLH